MTAPNHVLGGVVFTGIFCSFWNINIFSSPLYLGVTIFTSLLPDIDHTRSTIGKIFLPLAKYLDRNYGHRTITHSIIFLVITYVIVYIFSAFTLLDMNIPMIFLFPLMSHLIFDMLTVQGVPLFYPFKRNPCVIPGNPEHRLKGTASTEFVVFGIFSLLIFFCIPLFQNGFWMSYNTNFNTVMHLHRVYASNENLLKVKYEYTENTNPIKGEGLLLYAEEGKAFIFDSTRILTITSKAIIKELQPEKTNLKKEYKTIQFQNIELDSINNLLKNQIIVSGEITSNHPFNITKNNQIETKTHIKLHWAYNDRIMEIENPQIEKIKHLEFDLENEISSYETKLRERNTLLAEKQNVAALLKKDISDYRREGLMARLAHLEKEIERATPGNSNITFIQKEIRFLQGQFNITQNYSGYFTRIRLTRIIGLSKSSTRGYRK